MSLRDNEAESHYRLYDYRLQQLAGDWDSFYRMTSYHEHQHFQHSAPMTTSPYLDYRDVALPACSWRQLSTKATAVRDNGGWHQHPTKSTDILPSTSCDSTVRSSSPRSSIPWTAGVNSTCCDHSLRRVHDCHVLSDVRSAAVSAAGWRADDDTASYSSQQLGASCRQQVTRVVRPSPAETVRATAQRSAVDEFQTSSSTDRSHVGSPPVKSTGAARRSKDALVPLIIRAILSSADVRLSLADICRYIRQHSAHYGQLDDETRWHNNVRHTLSHYEFFVKCGRVPTGRGNYWTVHPVCRAAFAADDFRIKRARHSVQAYEKRVNVTSLLGHDHGSNTDRMI